MVRRILIPLDATPFTDEALNLGIRIAKATNAEITGLAILDIEGIEHSVGSVPVGGIYYAEQLIAARRSEAVDHIAGLLASFDKRCRAAGVNHRQAEMQGAPSDRILQESLYYDLVICGLRTNYHYEGRGQATDSLEKILGHTVTPILAVPERFKAGDPIRTLVAFDGSFPALRSLHQFAELAPTGVFDVRLFCAGDDEARAQGLLNRAAEFLSVHGFSKMERVWSPLKPIDAIRDAHLEWSDLVVLGMHSRGGILDFLVGGLSRFLIAEGNEVLLLGQ